MKPVRAAQLFFALSLPLAVAARADETPPSASAAPGLAFLLEARAFGGGGNMFGESDGRFFSLSGGAGVAAGAVIGQFVFGGEGEYASLGVPLFSVDGDRFSVGGYAGVRFPVFGGRELFEVRLRAGEHAYASLKGDLSYNSPTVNHAAMPFAGLEGRISIAVRRNAQSELRLFGGAGASIDLSHARLNQPGSDDNDLFNPIPPNTLRVGGLDVSISAGAELAFF